MAAAPRIETSQAPSSAMPGPLGTLARYHRSSRRAPAVALATIPLVLLYGLGLLLSGPGALSGADIISFEVLERVGRQRYVFAQGGIAAVLLALAAWHARSRTWRIARLTPLVVGESACWGLGLSAIVLAIMGEAGLLSAGGGAGEGVGPLVDRAVIAAGAGLHEEVVFRLLAIPAVALAAYHVLAMPRALAVALAVVLTSLLFAGAHHLAGEPFDTFAFGYRSVAGAIFAGLFLTRGFAVAAWTHAAYDFHVLGLS